MKTLKPASKALLYVALAAVLAVALFPILYPLAASFRSNSEIVKYATPFSIHTLWPVEWTLDNYVSLFRDYNFSRYILNTLIQVGAIIPLSILMCSVAAFAFTFFNFRGKKALFAIFMLTFMIPSEAIALPLYKLINDLHLVNTYWALILPALANGLTLFMFTQSFKDIPPSLLEAARIDGGGWGTCYWRIVMPLSKAIIVAMCLMTFVNEWNNYLWPLLVARLDNVKTVTIAICAFKDQNVADWGLIYSSSMLSALVPIMVFLPFQKYFVQGISSSGVKG